MERENGLLPLRLTVPREKSPDTLFGSCAKFFVKNLKLYCAPRRPIAVDKRCNDDDDDQDDYFFAGGLPEFRDGLSLSSEICDQLMESYQIHVGPLDDRFAYLFRDVTRTSLTSVRVRNSNISDRGLSYLLRHRLYDLTIEHCPELTHCSFTDMLEHAVNLRRLIIGPRADICCAYDPPSVCRVGVKIAEAAPGLERLDLIFARRSSIVLWPEPRENEPQNRISRLRTLNFSLCTDHGDLRQLLSFNRLHALILYGVEFTPGSRAISNICSLTSLVVLDVSCTVADEYVYDDGVLAEIVTSLPNLMYLDISGTNLAGTGTEQHSSESSSGPITGIPGLESRLNNPLHFLGLYKTRHNACRRHNIPAKIISGDANEIQILNAATSSMNKPIYLLNILDDIYHLLNNNRCTMISQVIDTLIEILTRHNNFMALIIHGLSLLDYIVERRNRFLTSEDIIVKQRIISVLISLIMYSPVCGLTMYYLAFTTLMKFNLFTELMFEFNRLVDMMIRFTCVYKQRCFQRFGIKFLRYISFTLSSRRMDLGNAGVIEAMMKLIKNQIKYKLSDDTLTMAWSLIFYVTDQTATNSKKFLEQNGIICCLRCLDTFPIKNDLSNFMLGSIYNVSRVKELRPVLMQSSFVQVFYYLLLSTEYVVCSNAAAIIVQLVSDGHTAWTIEFPTRHEILLSVKSAIDKWDLNANIQIDYHTIKPILQLAQVKHTHECVYWAVWTLANMTKKYPERYCRIVINEGSLQIMRELLEEHRNTRERNCLLRPICNLALIVINQCQQFLEVNGQ